MKRFVSLVTLFVVALSASISLLPPVTAAADSCNGQSFFLPKWYDDLCRQGSDEIKSPSDMSQQGSKTAKDTANNLSSWLGTIAMNIVKIIMTIVGYVAIGFVIWGGFKYMLNGDNASGTTAARKTIQNALIGIALSMMSIAIINFVTGAIT